MRKFVRGGSDEAHLVPYEGEEMAERRILTDKEKQGMYTMHCLGESKEAIADRYEVAVSTVYRIIREQREEHEKMASSSQIVAGDKANGRLMTCADRTRFEGTCIINGKSKKRTFTAKNARDAQQQWEKWCQTLRDEQDFMDMVERKREPLNETAPVEDAVDIAPAPIPEISVRPWKEVAEERQQRIDELEARIAELEDKERKIGVMDMVIAGTEGETPKLGHWFNNNGSFRVMWMEKPVYVLWAKTDKPRIYGVYRTIESALSEVDKLNEVAAFLGGDGAFEVEEVTWKG